MGETQKHFQGLVGDGSAVQSTYHPCLNPGLIPEPTWSITTILTVISRGPDALFWPEAPGIHTIHR